MKYMLTSEATNKEFYTVEEGDTYASISAKVGVTAWDVMRLNPKAGSVLTEGQTLLVRDSDPHLQVLVTGTIEYEVEIPYTVQRVEDASKYKGYEKTRVKGHNVAQKLCHTTPDFI
jgi:LysM repeat protein